MKNRLNENMLQWALKGTLCMGLVAGSMQLMAQEPAETSTVARQAEQMTTVTGNVKDAATGLNLAGVRVEALNDMRYTAMTDEEGNFTLQIPDYVKALYISTSDYSGVQYALRGKTEIAVKLYSDAFTTGYANGTDIMNTDAHQPGVTAAVAIDEEIGTYLGSSVRSISRSGTPGVGAAMFIQGLNSLNATAQPLVVLDGVVLDKQEGRAVMHDGFFNNVLAHIDVADIEKVRVIKNGTALYGSRGANGVILIDTKRGHSMATRIEANIYGGITLEPQLPDMMGATDYRLYASEMVADLGAEKRYPWLNSNPGDYYYNMYNNNTDWTDKVYKEAYQQGYKLNVQGGDDMAMYNFSLGYTGSEAPIEANSFDRLNIRFNTDVKLLKTLTTKFDMSYTRITRDLRDDGTTIDYSEGPVVSPTYLSLIKAPILNPYQYYNDGTLSNLLAPADEDLANLANPLSILENGDGDNKNRQEYTVFNVTLTPRLVIGKNFVVSTKFNYSLSRMNERYFRPQTSVPQFYLEGKGLIENETGSLYAKQEAVYSDTRLEYSKNWGAHSLDLFGGFRFHYNSFLSNYQTMYDTGNDKMPNLSTSQQYLSVDGDDDEFINLSYYANAAYNYQNKYFVEGTLTAETSSRFGRDLDNGLKLGGVYWGIFPSVQLGWLASSEDWFKVDFIDYLKLTAGFDMSGNDDMDYLASRTYFGATKYHFNAIGLDLQNIGNEQLQWETTRRFNVGLDMALFNNRLTLNASAFMSKTSDLLSLVDYPNVVGLGKYWKNTGELENKGFEVGANVKVINNKNFKWEVGATLAHYKNELTSLPGNGYTTTFAGAEILTQVGEAAGVFYGYETAGVFADDAAAQSNTYYDAAGNEVTGYLRMKDEKGNEQAFRAGDMHFVDQNKDGFIDEKDKTIIGDPNPDFYGNIFTRLNYKRFTLDIALNYSVGNDVYNYQRSQLESGSNLYNQTTAMLRRWAGEGHRTDMPRATYGDPMGNARFSDRWIEDGSYLRLKNVTLSYKVPTPVEWSWLQGLTVWCSGNNLFTLTDYLGSDPETSVSNGVLYQGIDTGLTPLSRNFNVGVKINL